jgi:hypothetical protein
MCRDRLASPTRHRIRSFAARHVALTLVLSAVVASGAGAETLGRPNPRIVNGVLTGAYPTVGALLRGASADSAGTWCSGTLIGCSTFLTAGHCVEGRSASDFYVYLPNAGIFTVASLAQHPSYDFPAADVAVLKLGAAVSGVAPSQIETSSPPPSGTPAVIAGYGRSGDPLFDYGLKRAGSVVTAPCSTIPAPGSDTTSVCWDYLNPLGPPGTDSNTCNADSGGPLFVDHGSGLRIAGVTSGGSSASCNPSDHSYDANVFTYRAFIQAQGGADLANTACGLGPQVGDPGITVLTDDGVLNSGTPQATFDFNVAGGTTRLRVAMNAVDDGVSDFDLYVKAGSAPTTDDYDCGRFGSNQYGFCEFTAPASGPWHVLVNRYAGSGTYQLTVTVVGTACGPGSDGVACDDENACTDGDACDGGACVGSPVANGTPCNDGNSCTAPDICQAGACGSTTLPNGAACDDGDPCSRPDTCQAGTCNGTTPAPGCKVGAFGASLLAIDNRSPDTRDRLSWTVRKGAATTLADFGNPTTTTAYTLCVYDDVGGVPQRRLTQVIPPGSRWKAFSRGFRYNDRTLSAGGLQAIVLTAGAAGRSSVQVRGRGEPLALPTLPFTKQPSVIVQLLSSNACWSSTHTNALDNGIARFKSKND